MPEISRRRFISGGAVAAGGAVVAGMLPATRAAAAPAARRSGTIADVKHVVILMQENRSFDHYYGSLGGVRGWGDKQPLTYPDGSSVLTQPDGSATLLPWHLDTARYDAQEAGDLDHSWPGTHAAWNDGAWNGWVGAKGEETMGYFTRADIPWQYALADAYTICDAYHCSIQGPTTPNRLYHWTGMIDPAGEAGGPAISNPPDYQPVYDWTTYPERLQKAGVSWQVYANDEVGDGADGYVGDYGDNPLWLFQAYHDALASSDPAKRQLAERASLRTTWKPDSGQGMDVDHVLAQFVADCAAGDLPTVSWVVAPYAYSEHPRARPVDGANYAAHMLDALWANDELRESTVVFLNFDENDGFFDHVPAPFAVTGTTGEYVEDLPIGLGPRVPMTVVSPWSRGGWVDSQVHDHTSVIRFLEVLTGVREPNISAWRRSVCGDLTTCFDFRSFDASVPTLPDTAELVAMADDERSLPLPVPPTHQHRPKPEFASRPQRRLHYALTANAVVSGDVALSFDNHGAAGASLLVYDELAHDYVAQPVLVGAYGSAQSSIRLHSGRYRVQVHGPDGFLRRFVGRAQDTVAVAARPGPDRSLVLDLAAGGTASSFVVASGGQERTIAVGRGKTTRVESPTTHGRYDVTVTSGDIAYRFAGKIEA